MPATELINKFIPLVPAFGIAFILSLMFTPWVGKFAHYIGAVDLPANQRRNQDRTKDRRVHKHVPALLGGVGMLLVIIVTIQLLGYWDNFPWGVILGLVVVLVYGFLDEIYDLPASYQLLLQLLAAFLVILSGVSVTSIQIAGIYINFNLGQLPIQIGEFVYQFIFPADLLTLLWIVGLMNVVNWVGGIDGLNGSVSSVISITMMLIAMKLGLIAPAIFLAVHAGAILGLLPYNYHLSKIFYGTAGDMGNGYILAVMSILAGTKLPLFLVIAGLPIIDGLVVVAGRFRRYPHLLKRPWKVLSVSDKSHFHHRLLELGFGHKGIMFLETLLTILLGMGALYLSDFRLDIIAIAGGLTLIVILIAVLSNLQKQARAKRELELKTLADAQPQVEIKVIDKQREISDRYRY